MELKDKIKKRRLELNLTLEDVAIKVGVSTPTIQRYESGEIKNMRRDKIQKLSDALNLSPAYLMGWTDDPIDYDRMDDLYMSSEYAKFGMDSEDYYNFKQQEFHDGLNDNNALSHHLSDDELNLLKSFNKLNTTGKTEAQKRVEELTLIDKYSNMLKVAARGGNITELPDSDLIDEDIKNSEDPDFL